MTPTLSALAIGSLTLNPTFNANTFVYTTTTTHASDSVSATAAAGVSKKLIVNGVEHDFGSVAWSAGANTVQVITYYDGFVRASYLVTVTKS